MLTGGKQTKAQTPQIDLQTDRSSDWRAWLAPRLERLQAAVWAALAGGLDSPRGFAAFYRLLFGRELPQHAREEWLPAIYRAQSEGRGTIIEAFRGSSKTTTLTVAWLAFRIGHDPAHSHLLVGGSDESARGIAKQVAEIIASHAGWRLAFPQVRPDRAAGWSAAGGYHVRRIDMSPAGWRAHSLQVRGKDPSLLGVGYRSGMLIGKHPTGALIVDDIHDEYNSRDGRELEMVREVLVGTLLPTLTPGTWQVFVGTPWAENDVLSYLRATGRYLSVRTPVYREESGTPTPTWLERFPPAEIEKLRQLVGSVQFARMYLLDLGAARGVHLRREWLQRYPAEKIDPAWPVVLGVDYASASAERPNGRGDYFAVAIGRALPGGAGMVLVDGFRARLSQGAAQARLIQLAEMYPTLQMVGVEAVGKGEEFYHLLLRSSRLPLRALHPGRASKAARFETGMAPLFEFRRAWLADVQTPFLQAFESEWLGFPRAAHDDTLDAVYWMLYAGLPHLFGGDEQAARPPSENPLLALSRE